MQQDKVTLVDEQDQVLGAMDKIEAHRGDGKLHRAVSVLLFRRNKIGDLEILVQQRSHKKIVGAEQWANTVCGNVWPDESYQACAKRRLDFELGISSDMPLSDTYTFRYQVQCNHLYSENEIDHLFIGSYSGSVLPNEDEVKDLIWLSWQQVLDNRSVDGLGDKDWAPWFKMMMADDELVKAVSQQAESIS